VDGAAEERVLELGNVRNDPVDPSPIRLQLSSREASVVSAWLRDFKDRLDSQDRYRLVRPVDIGGHEHYSFPTESVTIDQHEIPLRDLNWHVRPPDEGRPLALEFWIDVLKDDAPLLRMIKTYSLEDQAVGNGHSDLTLTLEFQNLSTNPLNVIATQWGPVGVAKEGEESQDSRRVTAGLAREGGLTAEYYPHAKLDGNPPFKELIKGESRTLEWVAVANKFFAVIVAPVPAGGQPWIADARATRVGGTDSDVDNDTFRLVTSTLDVPAGGKASRELDCYLGPKSKPVFTRDETYSRRQYVALINADYYACAWTWVVNLMLLLLSAVHGIWPHNYGIAIIVMVLIVRILLHPLTRRGQVSMTNMAEQMGRLQPKMEELREKYKNDRQRLNQETMKLYQQEGVNPASQMLTCLPMMFQMPIWAALWAALSYTVEMRHQPFFLWIRDLTAPDHFLVFSHSYPLIGNALNLLPPLLGVSMWLQNRFMPKPATPPRQDGRASDQMAQQRLMMGIMSVMMVVFFYHAPSGLTLYIMASNFFGLIEQHLIRKHITKEKEKARTRGPDEPKGTVFKKPKFLEKLEKLAEEARKS
jgi:YidC/Oxa1 family membrane protein insertase